MNYVIITPVRNEAARFAETIACMVAQTVRPLRWIIVNDGSTDATGRMAEQAAREHPWIQVIHRADRGARKPGGGVIEAFYDGYALLQGPTDPGPQTTARQPVVRGPWSVVSDQPSAISSQWSVVRGLQSAISGQPWSFLAKLDGDLSFAPDYFARCFERFVADAKLGIGGGRVYSRSNGVDLDDSPGDPDFHVRGATKIYRRECWDAIGGLLRAPGWDTLDELKANMLGWKTSSFRELRVVQLKPTGSADGSWRNWFKNGRANYITGYHPLFMLTKCAKRLFAPPIGLGAAGLFCGFASGYLRRIPQVADRELITYVRRQQLNRLLLRESLWR